MAESGVLCYTKHQKSSFTISKLRFLMLRKPVISLLFIHKLNEDELDYPLGLFLLLEVVSPL